MTLGWPIRFGDPVRDEWGFYWSGSLPNWIVAKQSHPWVFIRKAKGKRL